MIRFSLPNDHTRQFRLLCLGAHCDDIAIGCGGTILSLVERIPTINVMWVSITSNEKRAVEERKAADEFLKSVSSKRILVKEWRDGFLPQFWHEVKDFFEELKREMNPDLILTHYREDRHQDHRVINDLTWNTFRHHLILEYEIPKYDGDLGSPNVFVPFSEERCREKASKIMECFPSQVGRQWFGADVFMSLARLRGMEAATDTRYAEAFYCRKMTIG